jgi:hypothetical protein
MPGEVTSREAEAADVKLFYEYFSLSRERERAG